MKSIMVIDTQNGFVGENDSKLIENINNYLKNNNFDVIVYTKLMTNVNNISKSYSETAKQYNKEEQKLAVKKMQKGRVFSKKYHGMTNKILKYLFEKGVEEIELCGINNEDDFELIKTQLQNINIKAKINENLTKNYVFLSNYSKNNYFLTNNGFYIGDMLANNNQITSTSILAFALIEWLDGCQKTAEQFQKILSCFYKFFPSKIYKYSDSLAKWMDLGCRHYRLCEDFIGIEYCTPIGVYASTLSEINTLLEKTIIVTHNNETALIIAKVLTYSIYFLKTNTEKKCLIKKLQKIFDLNFSLNLEENIKNYKNNGNFVDFLGIILAIFINSDCYYNAISLAIKIDASFVSAVCALCDAYYKDIPMLVVKEFKAKLPKKFINLINNFGRITKENNAMWQIC